MKSSLLAFIFTMIFAITAQAQSQWVGGYGSYWDMKDFGDSETFGAGFVRHWPVSKSIAIEGRGVWYEDTRGPAGEQVEAATLGIGPAWTVGLHEKLTGYGSIVSTVFMYARDVVVDGQEVVDDDGVDFGLTFTGGLRLDLNAKWSLLAEAYYHSVTVDTKGVRDGIIVDDTIKLDGLGFNCGVGYSW